MRYGVVSDVHGNLHALEKVLAALGRAGVERILCAGDIVGYGPRPNECAARLAALGAIAVAGNHDLMAAGRMSAGGLPPLQRETILWTREELESSAHDYLAALPPQARTEDGVVVSHGSLDDPVEYVHDCTAAIGQLARLRERDPAARGLLLGHTHLPLACVDGRELAIDDEAEVAVGAGPWVLNAGAVGQSRERDPHARAMVLDTGRGTARFLALSYDVRATRRELRDAGLPPHACHLPPGRLAESRRALWRSLRRR
jgi:predicted phosphodiesterase